MPKGAENHKPAHKATASTAPRHQRPRANSHQRGYTKRWRRLRLMVLARQPICATPGCGQEATDVDHKISKAKGGDDSFENLEALCHSCHSKKTAQQDGA